MKLYFLINSLHTWWAERVVTNLANHMCKDHDVTILTLFRWRNYELDTKINHISLFQSKTIVPALIFFPITIYRLKQQIKHHNNGVSFLEIANFFHILAKKDAIISFRTTRNFFSWVKGKTYQILIKYLYKRAKTIIVNSNENQKKLQKKFPQTNIVTIYNPIDTKKIKKKAQAQDELPTNLIKKTQKLTTYITICRLIKTRHIDQILYTLAQLKKAQNFLYIIIGDWPEYDTLQELSQKLELEKYIYFAGYQKNIFAYLWLADYFLYASSVEGFPNTLLESIACNIPVITKDFETWAKEIITGIVTKPTKYPIVTEQWILLKAATFQTKLLEIVEKIDTYKFDPHIPNEFETKNVINERETILNKK